MHWFKHAGEQATGVEVRRRRHPDTPAYCARKIRDDVAKKVVCNDDVKSRGIVHHEDCCGVNVEIVDLDIWIVSLDLSNDARPQASSMDEHIGLVDECQFLAPSHCCVEGKANDPLDTVGSIHRHFRRDFLRCSGAQ